MATLRERLIARRLARRKPSSSSSNSLPIFVRPSEVSKLSPSARQTAVVVSGSISSPTFKDTSGRSVTSSGGSSSRVAQAQADFRRTQELQRQAEIKKAEELRQAEMRNQKIKADILRKQLEKQRQIANKILIEKSNRLKEEKNRLIPFEKKPSNIQEAIKRETLKQQKVKPSGLYIPKTDKFGKTEAYYEGIKTQREIDIYAKNLLESLQKKIDEGVMNVSEATKKLNDSVSNKIKQINARLDKLYPEAKPQWKLTFTGRKRADSKNFIQRAFEKFKKLNTELNKITKRKDISIAKKNLFIERTIIKIFGKNVMNKISGKIKGKLTQEQIKKIKEFNSLSKKQKQIVLSSLPAEGVEKVLDYSAKGWEDLLFSKKTSKDKIGGLGLKRTKFSNAIPKAITISGNIAIYFIPTVGTALLVSDISKSGKIFFYPQNKVEQTINQSYNLYKKETKVGENERLLTKKEYTEFNGKLIADQMKRNALLTIGLDVAFLSAGKILSLFKKYGSKAFNSVSRLSPKYLKFKDKKIIIDLKSKKVKVKKLTIETGTIATLKKPLSQQIKQAGTKLEFITTAQANRLIKRISLGTRTIRKPLPGGIEQKLTPTTKKLLKRFDKGQLTNAEFVALNRRIRKEATKISPSFSHITLLERSLYLDPSGALRISRLALKETKSATASLKDFFRANYSINFRSNKPQIIIFRNIKVEAFPKTKIFKQIRLKLSKNIKLNDKEIDALVRFQTKISGKAKPVGSTIFGKGVEPEVTIAPGEIIKRIKRLGFTIIDGKRVSIVEAIIVKQSSKLRKLIMKLKVKGKLNKKEMSELKKRYKKESGKNYSSTVRKSKKELTRRVTKRKPKLRTTAATSRAISRAVRKKAKRIKTSRTRTKKRATRPKVKPRARAKVTPRPKPPRPRVPMPRPPTPRGTIRPKPRTPTTRVKTKPTTRIIRRRKKDSVKVKKIKGKQGWNVYVKHKGKFIKANKKPLSQINAQNRASYIVDHSTSTTGKIKPVGKRKKLGTIKPRESSARNKIKARNYRIVKGKRISIGKTFIEKKGRPRINTRGEVRGLTAARLVKQLNKPSKKKKKIVRRKKKK